jgi:hypothetical protein
MLKIDVIVEQTFVLETRSEAEIFSMQAAQ